MVSKKQMFSIFFLCQLSVYSVYQNNNPKKLLSKESIKIKGIVVEFKGTKEILVEDKSLKTIETVVINEDTKEVSLDFNHENVELKVEENKYLNIGITQEMDTSKFTMNFEKKSDYEKNESWKLVTVTAIYR